MIHFFQNVLLAVEGILGGILVGIIVLSVLFIFLKIVLFLFSKPECPNTKLTECKNDRYKNKYF